MFTSKKIIIVLDILALIAVTILFIKNQNQMVSIEQYEQTCKQIVLIGGTIALAPLVITGMLMIAKTGSNSRYAGFELEELAPMMPISFIIALISIMIISAAVSQIESVALEDINATTISDDVYFVESSNFEDFYTNKYNIEYATENSNKFIMSHMKTEEGYQSSDELLSELNEQK